MTKIKNFRITLRPREIGRILKNQDHLQLTPALEASIDHAAKESKRFLTPAALYTTLTRATAEKATSIALPKAAIAVSVIAVTIGRAVEDELASAVSRADALQAALLAAIRQEGLAQSIQFAIRLIQDQAKDEECEMSEAWAVTEPPLLPSLATLLGIQRIGIELDTEDPVLPSYARLVWSAWTPLAKRSSRRPESFARAEKAAV
jgi:hypothetical protein